MREWSGLGGCCRMVFEASGVDEAADGVVGQVVGKVGLGGWLGE